MLQTKRPPAKQAEYALTAFKQFVGATPSSTAAALLLLLLVFFAWFTNTSYSLLLSLGDAVQLKAALGKWTTWVSLLTFPVTFAALWWLAGRASDGIRVVVTQHSPERVRGLILFLSHPGRNPEELQQRLEQAPADTGAFLESLGRNSWRMPLAAIDYHRNRLEKVVVIASADVSSGDKLESGSWRHLALFEQAIGHLGLDVEVDAMITTPQDFPRGVGFENAGDLVDAVDQAYAQLQGLGIRDREVLIDITGGQKICTVAGAAGALADNRLFQYVSTHDYSVHSYDVSYRP